jgi:hypothetical protein
MANGNSYALDFTANTHYIQIGNLPNMTQFTLEAWIYPRNIGKTNRIFTKFNGSGNTAGSIIFDILSGGTLRLGIANGTTFTNATSPSNTILANTWQHVAGMFDGNKITVYVNGEKVGETSFSYTIPSYTLDWRVGIDANTTSDVEYFDGKLDELKIWNVARTAEQIKQNYRKSLTGNESGLVVYYNLDEGSGITATNKASSGGFNGVINGATWIAGEVDLYVNKILIQLSDGEMKSIKTIPQLVSDIDAIPVMTSNTTPSGIASASSEYNATFSAWKAFDNVNDAYGWMTSNGVTTGWLAYEFLNPIIVGKYTLTCYSGTTASRMPKDWTFEGSNDGVNWTVLDIRKGEVGWSASEKRSYEFENDVPYQKYRINITANNGDSNYLSISDMEMMEVLKLKDMLTISIPSQTEQDFINYGMDKSTVLDLSQIMYKKSFIEKNSTTLGFGKVFSKSIDTTKLPIKKFTIQ